MKNKLPYAKRPEVKLRRKLRDQSPEGRRIQKKYRETAKFKAYQKAYESLPEVKALRKMRRELPENKAKVTARLQRPEVKARRRLRNQSQRVKQWTKEYHQRPEVKAKAREYYQTKKYKLMKKAYIKEHRELPHIKIKTNLSNRLRDSIRKYAKGKKIMNAKEYGINYKKIIEHLKPFPKDIEKYHIDHIKPLASYNFLNKDGTQNLKEIKDAFKPSNHQWLLAPDNLKKSSEWNGVWYNN